MALQKRACHVHTKGSTQRRLLRLTFSVFSLFAVQALLLSACGGKISIGTEGAKNKISSSSYNPPPQQPQPPPPPLTEKDPTTGVVTRKSCGTAADCQDPDAVCSDQGLCYKKDNPCQKITCNSGERCEIGTGQFANFGYCVPNCDKSLQCSGKCRSSSTAKCVDYTWVEPCTDGRNHCVTNSGPICCNSGSECVGNACVPVGHSCDEANGEFCKLSEYCQEIINTQGAKESKCIRYVDNPSLCTYKPTNIKDVKLKLTWRDHAVFTTPLVADVDGDQIPDITFVACPNSAGYLTSIKSSSRTSSPEDYDQIFRTPDKTAFSDITPALAELDGDPSNGPEIVVMQPDRTAANRSVNGISAFHGKDGSPYFNLTFPESDPVYTESGGITIGDIDGDGHPEIVTVGRVYSHDGKHLLFEMPFDKNQLTYSHIFSERNNLGGDVPVLADVNLDGKLDIIDGKMVFLFKSSQKNSANEVISFQMEQPTLDDTTTNKATRPYPDAALSAVANFYGTQSTYPQIVTAAGSKLYLSDWRGKTLAETDAPKFSNGSLWSQAGSPTISDFDGDGEPDIGVAFNGGFSVYKVQINSQGTASLHLLWYFQSTNTTSEITGSSVFDFDGDGIGEVLFSDNVYFYILSGLGRKETDSQGQTKLTEYIFRYDNPAKHIWGASLLPVVADVDNDGHADIVVATPNFGGSSDKGVKVFSNPKNNWVPTRSIWNQHAYDVTNINDNATVPTQPVKNWTKPWLNNYRQNVQEGNPFLAPDFIVKVDPPYTNGCSGLAIEELPLHFKVQNLGNKTAAAGRIKVSVYTVQGGSETEIFSSTNSIELPPGSEEAFTHTLTLKGTPLANQPFDLKFVVDNDNNYNECHEDNNETILKGLSPNPTDLSAEVTVPNALTCLSTNSATINVTVRNNGNNTIQGGTTNIVLYATIGSGKKTKIGDIDLPDDIAPGSSTNQSFDWHLDANTSRDKIITIEAVIDEANNVPECNEANNTTTTQFICQIIG